MNIILIIGIIFGSLILLVSLILLIPVGISVKTDKNGKIKVKLKILFIPYTLYPEKKKKSEKKKKKSKKEAEPEKEKSVLDKTKDLIKTVKEFSGIIGKVIGQLNKLLSKCVITKMKVDIVIADGSDAANAALLYGGACAVIYPLVEYLKDRIKFKKNADKVNIRCDFTKEKSTVYLNLKIKSILISDLSVLMSYLKKSSENEE